MSIRVERQHVGAILLVSPGGAQTVRCLPGAGRGGILGRHLRPDVAGRADRDKHLLPVRREDDIARPVSAIVRQMRHHDLRRPGRAQLAGAVGEAHHACGLRHIDEAGIGARWPERDAERLRQSRCKDRRLRWPRRAVGGAEYADAAGAALGQEHVAVGGNAQRAWTIEAGGELVHTEPRRNVQRCPGGPRHHRGLTRRRLRCVWRRQGCRRDVAHHARRVAAPVAIGGRAGQHRFSQRHRRRRTQDKKYRRQMSNHSPMHARGRPACDSPARDGRIYINPRKIGGLVRWRDGLSRYGRAVVMAGLHPATSARKCRCVCEANEVR